MNDPNMDSKTKIKKLGSVLMVSVDNIAPGASAAVMGKVNGAISAAKGAMNAVAGGQIPELLYGSFGQAHDELCNQEMRARLLCSDLLSNQSTAATPIVFNSSTAGLSGLAQCGSNIFKICNHVMTQGTDVQQLSVAGTLVGSVVDAYVNRDSLNATKKGCVSATGTMKIVCTAVNVVRTVSKVTEGVLVPVLLQVRGVLGGSDTWNASLDGSAGNYGGRRRALEAAGGCQVGDEVFAMWVGNHRYYSAEIVSIAHEIATVVWDDDASDTSFNSMTLDKITNRGVHCADPPPLHATLSTEPCRVGDSVLGICDDASVCATTITGISHDTVSLLRAGPLERNETGNTAMIADVTQIWKGGFSCHQLLDECAPGDVVEVNWTAFRLPNETNYRSKDRGFISHISGNAATITLLKNASSIWILDTAHISFEGVTCSYRHKRHLLPTHSHHSTWDGSSDSLAMPQTSVYQSLRRRLSKADAEEQARLEYLGSIQHLSFGDIKNLLFEVRPSSVCLHVLD